jgi:hypothetical protein
LTTECIDNNNVEVLGVKNRYLKIEELLEQEREKLFQPAEKSIPLSCIAYFSYR